MEEFYEKINDPALNGAIFVAVCRGKVNIFSSLFIRYNNVRSRFVNDIQFGFGLLIGCENLFFNR